MKLRFCDHLLEISWNQELSDFIPKNTPKIHLQWSQDESCLLTDSLSPSRSLFIIKANTVKWSLWNCPSAWFAVVSTCAEFSTGGNLPLPLHPSAPLLVISLPAVHLFLEPWRLALTQPKSSPWRPPPLPRIVITASPITQLYGHGRLRGIKIPWWLLQTGKLYPKYRFSGTNALERRVDDLQMAQSEHDFQTGGNLWTLWVDHKNHILLAPTRSAMIV